SFTVRPGETVALVGPSGGGKTTAASLIPRFWDVSSGAVLVGSADVRKVDPHVLMNHIAFVFQNSRLFKASILENVRAARPDASRGEVLQALEAAQCGDILAKLPKGVDTVIGTDGTHLSGGEQQRVALARAILKDAPIIVLDEATAFADPENEALIQRALKRLTKGRTVVMIAHRLSTVVGADNIIVLDSGRVSEQGTHEQLVQANALYARMWTDYNRAAQWKISSDGEVA
ncbi:MAG: ABC transporter ATP-binding protein, partial [bacterium]